MHGEKPKSTYNHEARSWPIRFASFRQGVRSVPDSPFRAWDPSIAFARINRIFSDQYSSYREGWLAMRECAVGRFPCEFHSREGAITGLAPRLLSDVFRNQGYDDPIRSGLISLHNLAADKRLQSLGQPNPVALGVFQLLDRQALG